MSTDPKETLKKAAPIYYDLPTTNYLMYGIKYWLDGLFNEDRFIEYAEIILEHDSMIRRQLHQLEKEFFLRIIPCSTLDNLGLTRMAGKELIAYISKIIPSDKQSSDYQSKASCLIEHMLKVLTSQSRVT